MHLRIENFDTVDMNCTWIAHSMLLGLVSAAYMDLCLLKLHTVMAKV